MGEGLKGPMTNLARVIQDLAQPGTRGEVQSDYLTDKMSVKEVILASFNSTEDSTNLPCHRSRFCSQDDIGLHHLRPSFHFKRRQSLHIEKSMDMPVRIV